MAATVRFLFFSRRLQTGMQIQVGFSLQEEKNLGEMEPAGIVWRICVSKTR